jgi:hypothetical protein
MTTFCYGVCILLVHGSHYRRDGKYGDGTSFNDKKLVFFTIPFHAQDLQHLLMCLQAKSRLSIFTCQSI